MDALHVIFLKDVIFHLFYCLPERQVYRENDIYIYIKLPSVDPGLIHSEAWSQYFSRSPTTVQNLKALGYPQLSSQATAREMDAKRCSRGTDQCPYGILEHPLHCCPRPLNANFICIHLY